MEGQSSLRIKAGYNEDEEPGCNAIRSASVHNSTQLGTEPESGQYTSKVVRCPLTSYLSIYTVPDKDCGAI